MSDDKANALDADSPGTPERWLVLILVALDYFILYAHRQILGYLKKPLMDELHLDSAQFGWLGLAFLMSYAISQIGVGFLGDRFRRRSVLLCSLSISVVSMATMGLARSFTELILWRVVMGVAQSASVPAIASAMADSFTSKTRSKAVGIYLNSSTLALILAAMYSGRIADTPIWHVPLEALGRVPLEISGWRMAMFCFAGIGALGLLLFAVLFPEPPRAENAANQAGGLGGRGGLSIFSSLRAVLSVRSFWTIMAAYVVYVGPYTAVLHWLPGHLQQRFNLKLEDAAFDATIWINLALACGLLVGGPLSDRLARRFLMGRTAVQIAGLAMSVPALIYLGQGTDLTMLAIPMFVYGFGSGFYQTNLWTTTFEVVNPIYRATAIGLLNVAAGLGGSWCNPLVGMYETRYGEVGFALASLSALVLLSALISLAHGIVFLPRDYRGTLRKTT